MSRLEPGDKAPAFSLPDQDGAARSLAKLLAAAPGKGIVLFAYPAAMTPGCTKEACDFRDSTAALIAAGWQPVGISPDSVEKLRKFADKESLDYPLLSDADKSVLTAYGAFGEKSMYGRTTIGVIRSTFVIGKNGKIVEAQYAVKATGHVGRLLPKLGVA
jgi:thioredoxin-dependent peroxiredoxin